MSFGELFEGLRQTGAGVSHKLPSQVTSELTTLRDLYKKEYDDLKDDDDSWMFIHYAKQFISNVERKNELRDRINEIESKIRVFGTTEE